MAVPLVTVVVSSYNREPLLRRALDSVAAQTAGEWECLVCDDGSTDGTHDMVEALAAGDARFRLCLGPRFGLPGGPRNRGIREARAPWVAFLDDDDFWHPAKLAVQLALAQRVQCDAVSTAAVPFTDEAVELPLAWREEDAVRPGEQPDTRLSVAHVLLMRRPYPCTPSNMIRREALVRARGFSEAPAYRAVEDYDLWLRLIQMPAFRWWVAGGPPLVAFRELGADSISAWTDRVHADYARRRWAYLECVGRAAARALHGGQLSPDDRAGALRVLAALATECAHLSRLLGWRRASWVAYHLAAGYAALGGSARRAAVELSRAVRFALLAPAPARSSLPPFIPELVRRSLRNALALLARRPARPLPVGMSAGASARADVPTAG